MLNRPLADDDELAQRMRKLFGTVPRRLQVAALPWRRMSDGVEIMLITSRDTGRWVLPKGWPEAREPLCEAAAREAAEEAGLHGLVSPIEAGRYLYAKTLSCGQMAPCEVLVFPLQVLAVHEKWKERRQRERRWVPFTQGSEMVDEPDLGRIICIFGADPENSAA